MLPLWIINLGEDRGAEEKLSGLMGGMSASLRPFWRYSHLETGAVGDWDSFRGLQSLIIKEGQNCYNGFMDAGLRVQNFQIVVIGSADEALSQSVFAPLAGVIRDSLPAIVADHANLGVEITGLVYVPSTANQEPDSDRRKRMAVFLEEVNLLSGGSGTNAYNQIVAYSDIQHQSCRYYERLSVPDRTELLFQYLTHLFLGSSDNEKLFDRIGHEGGVYVLGASSVFFNQQAHRNHELKAVLDALFIEFKDMGNRDEPYAATSVRNIIDTEPVFPEDYAGRLTEGCASINVNLRKLEGTADPHPVWDLLKVDLFPAYYRKYLRFMPARIIRFMQDLSYALLSRFGGIIRQNARKASDAGILLLRSAAGKILADKANPYPTIAQIESFYAKARQRFEDLRTGASLPYSGIIPVPKYLKADYERFETGADGDSSDILDKLKKNLRKEPVVLSLVVRCFFLGVLLVFIAVPVLQALYPSWMAYAWGWIPLLFLLPLLVELLGNVRRHFKRVRRLKYRLLAATLHSVNGKLFKELTDALDKVYGELIAECDGQLQRLDSFRKLITVPDPETGDLLLPRTRFNQPLLDGAFNGEKMVRDAKANQSRISLPTGDKRLSDMEKEDYIKLLGILFQDPLSLSAFTPTEATQLKANADGLVESFRGTMSGLLHSMEEADISTVVSRLSETVDLAPLRKMAGLNSMFFSAVSGNTPVLKTSEEVRGLEDVSLISDASLTDYVMLTTWLKLPSGLQAQQICDSSVSSIVPAFSDLLALYYAYYREKKSSYRIGGTLVTVRKADMEYLNEIIGG